MAQADLVQEIAVQCPNCGVKFASRQLPIFFDLAVRNSELRQDFKGELMQVEQFAVATCPSCGKADWVTGFDPTDEQPAMTQQILAPHTQFRSAAVEAERRGSSFMNVGMLYLHAAWCADDSDQLVQAREYRKLAIDAFRKAIVEGSCPAEKRAETEYLIGELYRRAGEFEACLEHFRQVMPFLPSQFAIMGRKLMRLAQTYNSEAIDFAQQET